MLSVPENLQSAGTVSDETVPPPAQTSQMSGGSGVPLPLSLAERRLPSRTAAHSVA